MPIIYDALYATGYTMAGLATIAVNAPSEQFLVFGGAVSMGCALMLGVCVTSWIYPTKVAFNLWLYGGVFLYGLKTLYDV